MDPGIDERYQAIRKRIEEAIRSRPSSFTQPVTLIAVSKVQPVEAIEALYRLGHRDFGENYVQELVAKAEELKQRGCEGIRWHMIGHLQTNKVKALLPWVSMIHSVDSEKLAHEIHKRWQTLGKNEKLPVFIEVNIDEEPSKSGVLPAQLPGLMAALERFPGLEIEGLMGIPNPVSGSSEPPNGSIKVAFRKLRELGESFGAQTRGQLSMGMTQDFEIAIHEGATHIRIGTAIFGARRSPAGSV